MNLCNLSSLIISVQGFPSENITFRDITPLLRHPQGIQSTVELMANRIANLSVAPTVIAGPESRGFIFGVALAQHLSIGFVPIRKKGKLPRERYQQKYDLEYGSDILEVHKDAFDESDKVLIVDDLLATGGTTMACIALIEKSGAKALGSIFLMELLKLKGREKLNYFWVDSLLKYS